MTTRRSEMTTPRRALIAIRPLFDWFTISTTATFSGNMPVFGIIRPRQTQGANEGARVTPGPISGFSEECQVF